MQKLVKVTTIAIALLAALQTGLVKAMELNHQDENALVLIRIIRAKQNDEKTKIEKLQEALKNRDVNSQTKFCWAVLHELAGGTYLDIIKFLIKNGTKIDIKDHDGRTPLQIATRKGLINTVACLIENGAKIDEVDMFGSTALIYATFLNYPEIVKYLIEKDADIDKKSSNDDAGALYLAAKHGFEKIVRLLAESGAKISDEEIEIASVPAIKEYLANAAILASKNVEKIRQLIKKQLTGNAPAAAKNNFNGMLRLTHDKKAACQLYDLVCETCNREEQKTFGFVYQNVKELYLDVAKHAANNKLLIKWLIWCLELCSCNMYKLNNLPSQRSTFENAVEDTVIELTAQKPTYEILKKEYKKNILPGLNRLTLCRETKTEKHNTFTDLKIKFKKITKLSYPPHRFHPKLLIFICANS